MPFYLVIKLSFIQMHVFVHVLLNLMQLFSYVYSYFCIDVQCKIDIFTCYFTCILSITTLMSYICVINTHTFAYNFGKVYILSINFPCKIDIYTCYFTCILSFTMCLCLISGKLYLGKCILWYRLFM